MSAGRVADLFAATFGRPPGVIASAPGRVNLIGEHTDYNGGQVLPMAIAARTWVAMAPGEGVTSRAVSGSHGDAMFSVSSPAPVGGWTDYVHGTLRALGGAGLDGGEVDVAVWSDVPAGAGLSSSAALAVATAVAATVVRRGDLREWRERIAMVAHRAETAFVGVPCGIMDQVASAHGKAGHAVRIWCDTGRREHVPFGRAVLVVDTTSPRALRGSAFGARQLACQQALAALRAVHPGLRVLAAAPPEWVEELPMSAEARRRARHVVSENQRVEDFVRALSTGGPLGALLAASHASLRDDYECSSPELDWVVEAAAAQAGVEGARLTGAGWGGCAIVIGHEGTLPEVADTLTHAFRERWGRDPRTWVTFASRGAALDHAAAPSIEHRSNEPGA